MAKFCSNCGSELLEGADGCVKCGKLINGVRSNEKVVKSATKKFCINCGNEVSEGADICLKCGKLINPVETSNFEERKSQLIAGLLALYIGGIGIHNFYLGNNMKGIIHLVLFLSGIFTFGITTFGSVVWAFIEAISIFMKKDQVDYYGNPLKN